MEDIKVTVLAYLRKGEKQEASVSALDCYLVYVKKEDVFIGGNLLAVIQEMINNGLLAKGNGSVIKLSEKGREL